MAVVQQYATAVHQFCRHDCTRALEMLVVATDVIMVMASTLVMIMQLMVMIALSMQMAA